MNSPMHENAKETERVKRIWERFAPKYDKSIGFWERVLFKGGRQWIASQAEGDVLEVAIGTGRNLEFYAPHVRLTGIEFSPAMLDIARQRAAELSRDVELVEGDAQDLPFEDERFDTVVFSLCLCSIPDDGAAVAEAKRVLRPGGRVVAYEHVASTSRPIRATQSLLNFFTVRFQGDHLLREPEKHFQAEGFEIQKLRRSGAGIVERIVAVKRT
jgi:ubiquinone/menaquinone biosynthesis C-methylase UbiE